MTKIDEKKKNSMLKDAKKLLKLLENLTSIERELINAESAMPILKRLISALDEK